MKTSSRALIWVIGVFAAGIVLGTALTLVIVRHDQGPRADGQVGAQPPVETTGPTADSSSPPTDRPRPSDRRDRLVARVLRQLRLDAGQEAEVRAILEESRLRQQRLERRRRQELARIRRQTLREIRQVLNPEQQKQLEEILRRLNRRRRRD